MLKDKIVIIAGGLGLLGKNFVEGVINANGIVIIADINESAGNEFKNLMLTRYSNKVVDFHHLDITSETSIQKIIHVIQKKYGRIDAFVNTSYPRNKNWGNSFENVTYKDFCENVNMHLGGYFLCSQQFGIFFRQQGYGNIINISSIYGVIAPKFDIYDDLSINDRKMTMPVEYAPIKSGIIHLTKYLSKYFKNTNVRFNCISPGGILAGQPQKFIEKYNSYGCSKGMLDPQDLVGSLIFLLSDGSKYINGQNLIVDDGWTL